MKSLILILTTLLNNTDVYISVRMANIPLTVVYHVSQGYLSCGYLPRTYLEHT